MASTEQILEWSYGEVTKPETINYRTLKPERDGLYCERIFGPTKDWECNCGKYKRIKFKDKNKICDKCGVQVTRSKVRRERMGHIQLAAPVSHIWYFKGIPSRMGMLLDISPRTLEKVLYFANFIVLDPGDPNETGLKKHELITDAKYREIEARCGAGSFRAGMGAEAVKEMLMELDLDAISEKLKKEIAELAERALLCELAVTPKPGLVDMETNGAHEDMDRFTFVRSACALRPYFERCACLGMENRSTEETFFRLRREGLLAEETMLAATGGVNSHKGAIFSLGLLCCAAGAGDEPCTSAFPFRKMERAHSEANEESAAGSADSKIFSAKGVSIQNPCATNAEAEHTPPPFPESIESKRAALLRRAAALAAHSMEDLSILSAETAKTGGERDYLRTGRTGARGEAAAGFPSVVQIALPTLEKALAEGKSANLAGLEALTALMRTVADANVLRRAGEEGLKRVQHSARQSDASPESLRALDREFTAERLSPGGCADLLAAAWLLHFLQED